MAWPAGLIDRGPEITGTSVRLRYPRASDYAEWRHTREASREFLQPWEPTWQEDEFSRQAFRDRLAHYRREQRDGTARTFFLFPVRTETVLGGLTIGRISHGVSKSCQLGYWMGEMHAGQGLMAEALALVIPYVFDGLGLHRIEAACIPENTRSRRLLENAGFKREGTLRGYLKINGRWQDHYLYALLGSDRERISH